MAHVGQEARFGDICTLRLLFVGPAGLGKRALAEALAGDAEHFAGLLSEETGWTRAQAMDEISSACEVLRFPTPADTANGVLAILCDRHQPFLAAVRHAVSWLLAGGTVILKPSPHVPSALFALAAPKKRLPRGLFSEPQVLIFTLQRMALSRMKAGEFCLLTGSRP